MLIIGAVFFLALSSKTALRCNNKEIYSWHWFIMDGIDLVQSLLITASSIYLIRHIKTQLA